MQLAGPKQIKMARYALGLTVRELAERAQIQPNTISRIENGHQAFAGTLEKITKVLEEAGAVFIDNETQCGVLVDKHKR